MAQVIKNVISIPNAETTANTLAFIVSLVSQHPDVQVG